MKAFLLTLATLFALIATGLLFAWGFSIFDDPAWRRDATGWLAASAACFAASFHPLVTRFDTRY